MMDSITEDIVSILKKRASKCSGKIAFSFVDTDGEVNMTYSEIDYKVTQIANVLASRFKAGDKILLLYPAGLNFVCAFFACLYAGLIPIPQSIPRRKQSLKNIISVSRSCKIQAILTQSDGTSRLQSRISEDHELSTFSVIKTDSLIDSRDTRKTKRDRENVAFIQFTSGSTSSPRGVLVSHKNIIENLNSLKVATQSDENDIFVNWLPLFHDLGLVNTVLLPVYLGATTILMSPIRFIKNPRSWLAAISKYGGTIAGAPNFGFDHCVTRISTEYVTGLDLSSWRVCFNAAEPISSNTLLNFNKRFSSAGFRFSSFYPSYGMAEATVFVSGGNPNLDPVITNFDRSGLLKNKAIPTRNADSVSLVGCGHAHTNHKIKIVDQSNLKELKERQIGEIWVKGPSISSGYWMKGCQNENKFRQSLSFDDHGYMRTGDLGFIDKNELYVTGRIKDLIIVRGNNYYPQDIEKEIYSSSKLFQSGNCAVIDNQFDDSIDVIVVQELSKRDTRTHTKKETESAIKCVLSKEFDLSSRIIFVNVGDLPKTSSGKVQRQRTLRMVSDGKLTEIFPDIKIDTKCRNISIDGKSSTAYLFIIGLWNQLLGEGTAHNGVDFFSSGGDSVGAANLVHEIEKTFSVGMSLEDFYENPTIESLVAKIEKGKLDKNKRLKNIVKITGKKRSCISDAQRRIWIQHNKNPGTQFNLLEKVKLRGKLNPNSLTESLEKALSENETFRTRYLMEEDNVIQVVGDKKAGNIKYLDFSKSSNVIEKSEEYYNKERQRVFDLEKGDLYRIILIKQQNNTWLLIVNIHHIAADAETFRILIRRISQYYNGKALSHKNNILPTYIDYSIWQNEWIQSNKYKELESFWINELKHHNDYLQLPLDFNRSIVQTYEGSVECEAIPESVIAQCLDLSKKHGATLYVILLTAYQVLLHKITNQSDFLIGADVSNRSPSDIKETLGFFVNHVAIRSKFSSTDTLSDLINRAKDKVFSAVSHQELPFERLLSALGVARNPAYSPLFQTNFLLSNSPIDELNLESVSASRIEFEENFSTHDLTLNVKYSKEKGYIATLVYNTNLFKKKTINNFLKYYLSILKVLSLCEKKNLEDLLFISEQKLLLSALENKFGYRSDLAYTNRESQFYQAEMKEKLTEMSDEQNVTNELDHKKDFSLSQYVIIADCNSNNNNKIENLIGKIWISKALSIDTLKTILSKIISRHEILRTLVFVEDEIRKNRVVESFQVEVQKVDLCKLNESEKRTEILNLEYLEKTRLSNLNRDLPIRFKLLKCSENSYLLLVCMHPMVSDWNSMVIFSKEFELLFNEYINHIKNDQLIPLPKQYTDYVTWQRMLLSSELLEKQLKYWQKKLKDLPSVHSLPLDRPRPAKQSFNGGCHSQSFDENRLKNIQQFCTDQDVTPFMLFHTVLSILLSRYSNEKDIVIGTAVSGRIHEDYASLIGLFVNSLVLRSDLSVNLPFDNFLQKNRQTILAAYEHQQIPIELLVEAINPEYKTNHSPLFQIILSLQDNKHQELFQGDVILSGVSKEKCRTKYDLEINIVESERELIFVWTYNKDLFEEATIERFASSFQVLLEDAISAPEKKIQELSILTESQRKQLLVDWNDTAEEYTQDVSVSELFEQQVKRSPNAMAVVFNNEALTYEELNIKANQLANYLVDHDIENNRLLGVCVERSLDMVIALLAIMKAGCAYLPLDPSYPNSRLTYMLQDANVDIVLTQLALEDQLASNEIELIILDDPSFQNQLEDYSIQNPKPTSVGLTSQSLAYVIYTSGSTGQPKGVMIEQAALVNFLFSLQSSLAGRFCSTTKLLAVSTISFDISVLDLYGTLLSGGQVIIASRDDAKNPYNLINLIEIYDINIFQATPTTWQLLMDVGWQGKSDLLALSGGEVIETKLIDYLLPRCHQLMNCYGPTETTVWSMMYKVESSSDVTNFSGSLNNYTHYVFSHNEQLAPIGVVGELHIGGKGLSRGYLNRPELTRDKFIPNPFSETLDTHLYKTGDLACWLPDGKLEFIGRIDDQVKLRGYRIELSEIQIQLSRVNGIKRSCVVVYGRDSGRAHLVACIELNSKELSFELKNPENRKILIKTYRNFLSKNLPDYMIPSEFTFFDNLPRLPNGKIDRLSTIKSLDINKSVIESNFIPNVKNKKEKILCEIWQEIFDQKGITVKDNFFELGGDSVVAVKLVSRARQRGLQFSLKHIFESQTVEKLAAVIELDSQTEVNQYDDSSTAHSALIDLWDQYLGEGAAHSGIDFFSNGGKLAGARNLVHEIEKNFSVRMSIEDFYENPTIESLLAKIDKGKLDKSKRFKNIVKITGKNRSCISDAQRRIWIQHNKNPGTQFNLLEKVKLRGKLNPNSLTESLEKALSENETFRTRYLMEEDNVIQVVGDKKAGNIKYLDFSKSSNVIEKSEEYYNKERQRVFDLEKGDLYRIILIKQQNNTWLLIVNIHHIAADAETFRILIRRISQYYNGKALSHKNNILPTYIDYSIWQNEWIQSNKYKELESFWINELKHHNDYLQLPLDFNRSIVQTYEGSVECEAIPESVIAQCLDLSKKHGATLYVILLTAYQVLLHKITNQSDFLIGADVSNRSPSDIKETLGFFVNHVAIRSKFSSTDTLSDLINRAKDKVFSAVSHQELPFERLLSALGVARNPAYSPLFQTNFLLSNSPIDELNLESVSASRIEFEENFSTHDLTLNVKYSKEKGYIATLVYNTNLFKKKTINNFLKYYLSILKVLSLCEKKNLEDLLFISEQKLLLSALENKFGYRSDLAYTNRESQFYQAEMKEKLTEMSDEQNVTNELDHKKDFSLSQYVIIADCNSNNNNKIENLIGKIWISKALSIDTLKTILSKIISRHEILRTLVFVEDEIRKNRVVESFQVEVQKVDLCKLNESEKRTEILNLEYLEKTRLSNLNRDLPIRFKLLKCSENSYLLLVCMHPMVSDWNSMVIFSKEFELLFNEYINHIKNDQLIPLPKQYTDYVTWQRMLLSSELLEKQLKYWQKKLKDLPSVHSLPLDRPRPAKQSFNGGCHSQSFDENRLKNIQQFCTDQDVTPFMLFHTVLSILLSRYSNEKDIVIGTAVSGRIHEDYASLIGLFVNSLVLRSDLSVNLPFDNFLQKNRQTILAAYEHQQIPIELLVEAINPEYKTNHSPLFQIILSLQDNKHQELFQGDVILSGVSKEKCRTKYDLEINIVESERELIFVWTYNKDLFEEATIERFASSFQVLLEDAISAPEKKIQELSILTESQRKQLLVDWNDTAEEYTQDVSVSELFEQQVKRSPNAMAVVFNNEALTYEELNIKANQLANYLVDHDIENNRLLGVCVERSLDMVIALLAIMKAGCAYLPLDPSYPNSRLTYMLQDANVDIVLTQLALEDQLASNEIELIILDDPSFQNQLEDYSIQNPKPTSVGLTSQSLAYVIYTSGSTGQPKGVMIEQAALVNFLFSLQSSLAGRFCSTTKLLAVSTISFDISVLDLYGTLLSGGQVIIASRDDAKNPYNLINLIEIYDINIFQATPTTWQLLMDVGWQGKSDLLALSGGEAIETRLAEFLLSHCNKLMNCYGPTEATVWSMMYEIKNNSDVMRLSGGLKNYTHYVLNHNENLAPIGVVGELHIGGKGLSRGYLNHPKLTTEKFIPSPFSDALHTRLYKTGDLVCRLPDGSIEFIGRIDDQVKIRGYRIELSEIQFQLSCAKGVKRNCVIVHKQEFGRVRLVACIELNSTELSIKQKDKEKNRTLTRKYRDFLSRKLPDYMIPSEFMFFDSFPELPNGKVDRKSLVQNIDLDEIKVENRFKSSIFKTKENVLCEIWREILGENEVTIKDNFFELGGDSVVAVKLVSRAKQRGLQISLKNIFENQTVEKLAAVVELADQAETNQDIVKDAKSKLPSQLEILSNQVRDSSDFNQWVLLESPLDMNSARLAAVVEELLRRHDVLRLRLNRLKSNVYQEVNKDMLASSTYYFDFRNMAESNRSFAFQEQSKNLYSKIDTYNGPTFIAAYFDFGLSPGRLLIILHHSIIDSISWQIILSDIEQIFLQLRTSKVIKQTIEKRPFKNWSDSLDKYSRSDELISEKDYWLAQLSEQFYTPKESFHDISSDTLKLVNYNIRLERKYSEIITGDGKCVYKTHTIELLLTALLASFYKITSLSSLGIYLESDGRSVDLWGVDNREIVGCFKVVHPFVLSSSNPESFSTTLKQIKEAKRRIPNAGVGYGLIKSTIDGLDFLNSSSKSEKSLLFRFCENDQNLKSDVFKFIDKSSDSTVSALAQKKNKLVVTGMYLDGELNFSFECFSNEIYEQFIVSFADQYVHALKKLSEELKILRCRQKILDDNFDVIMPTGEISELEGIEI
ncbi:amino acid adenylation domain-containing protein [Microbulbifer epialgicus]|uniref:Amino acid adenylation domain-containing protein n=1 Tax=Microbulbifer epialgicus TaxID=393907 RepID=A0ABV4NVQ2_9GAMM